MDEPEAVITIIKKYPDFKAIYEQIYDICRNIEEVMGMFSEELRELDRANQKSKKERLTGIVNIIELCRELDLSLEITEQKVMQKYSLSEDEAHEYMSIYWKV